MVGERQGESRDWDRAEVMEREEWKENCWYIQFLQKTPETSKNLPHFTFDYIKFIPCYCIYFLLVKTSLTVIIKVEVVCEVGLRRALRVKLRWYMVHRDSIKTMDLCHLGKWRSLMLGSCDIYKIKLFLNIWSYITCFFPFLSFFIIRVLCVRVRVSLSFW